MVLPVVEVVVVVAAAVVMDAVAIAVAVDAAIADATVVVVVVVVVSIGVSHGRHVPGERRRHRCCSRYGSGGRQWFVCVCVCVCVHFHLIRANECTVRTSPCFVYCGTAKHSTAQ